MGIDDRIEEVSAKGIAAGIAARIDCLLGRISRGADRVSGADVTCQGKMELITHLLSFAATDANRIQGQLAALVDLVEGAEEEGEQPPDFHSGPQFSGLVDLINKAEAQSSGESGRYKV